MQKRDRHNRRNFSPPEDAPCDFGASLVAFQLLGAAWGSSSGNLESHSGAITCEAEGYPEGHLCCRSFLADGVLEGRVCCSSVETILFLWRALVASLR